MNRTSNTIFSEQETRKTIYYCQQKKFDSASLLIRVSHNRLNYLFHVKVMQRHREITVHTITSTIFKKFYNTLDVTLIQQFNKCSENNISMAQLNTHDEFCLLEDFLFKVLFSSLSYLLLQIT